MIGPFTVDALGGLAGELPAALAYVGPGSGLAAIGALLTVVGAAVFMVVGFVWYPLQRLLAASRRRRGKTAGAAKQEARYTPPDRFLHRMAFSTVGVQKALADLEDRLWDRRIADVGIDRPVFIASLPRAGTTLLLEALYSSGRFAAHTYRHMPFLFIPLLWNAVSRRFRLAGRHVGRAHGDGLTIDYDSAEAFEEALWRAFHPSLYLADRILPWPDGDDFASAEFEVFIKNHVRKVIALSAQGASEGKRHEELTRYLSKNNGNLSRLGEVVRLFPDATVLVPLRQPLDHAASLLRTHARFEEIHAKEAFARRYMKDIGHFDFGANLRPIDFAHWLDGPARQPASSVNFWLSYWCAAFGHVLAALASLGDHIVLVDYDGLCAQPMPHLERIAGKTGLTEPPALAQAAARFRAPTRVDAAALDVDRTLLDRASALHRQLLPYCLD